MLGISVEWGGKGFVGNIANTLKTAYNDIRNFAKATNQKNRQLVLRKQKHGL